MKPAAKTFAFGFVTRCCLAFGLAASLGCAAGVSGMKDDTVHAADLILAGGIVHTMNPSQPRAEAVSIRGGRIEAVGSSAEIRRAAGPKTVLIDLAGRMVVPGLVDAHCHLYGLGHAGETLSLRGVTSAAAASATVAEAARSRREGEWIQGRGWDQNMWSPPEFPTHKDLDKAVPAHPVALRRVDGHALWANLAAMRAAGISRDTKDPSGGRLIRDANGEPTGIFVDHAMDLITDKIPRDTPEVRERKILAAADRAVASGLTAVHEMGIDDDTIAVYRSLAAAGRLKLRVYAFLSGAGQIDTLPSRKPDIDTDGTAMFVLRAVKLYADGALGSRGAALLQPYTDDPGNSGLVLMSQQELEKAARVAAATGFQLGVHAIGDRANRTVLDAFEAAGQGKNGVSGRFRIEHAQVVSPADIPRFAKLGVIASMQPTHATSDMPWADERLGPDRLAGAYAWRSILATGAHIAGGSDFPVEEVSPLLGLYAAVTRQDPKGSPPGGWLPDQRLTLDEALRIFTVEPAWASFVEDHRGKIAPRQVADLTVLDQELVAGSALLERRVELTIVGGKVAYERPR